MIPVSGATAVLAPESCRGPAGKEVSTYGCPVGFCKPGTPPLDPHHKKPEKTQHLSAQHDDQPGVGLTGYHIRAAEGRHASAEDVIDSSRKSRFQAKANAHRH